MTSFTSPQTGDRPRFPCAGIASRRGTATAFVLATVLAVATLAPSARADRRTLARFGRDAASTQTPYADWSSVLRPADRTQFTEADSTDPAHWGLVESPAASEADPAWFGVAGSTPLSLRVGHRIIATFFNRSESTEYLLARVSFTDPDGPDPNDADHPWFTLCRLSFQPSDTGRTEIPVAPRSLVEVEFYVASAATITAPDVPPSEGDIRRVCINKPDGNPAFVLTHLEWADNADFTPPGAPVEPTADLVATTSGCAPNLVRLRWKPALDPGPNASGISRYLIYRDGALYDSISSDMTTHLGADLSYVDLSVLPSTRYEYRIAAVDRAPVGIHPTAEHPARRHGNEGPATPIVSLTTPPWSSASLVHPSVQTRYLGVIRLPYTEAETWAWAQAGLAFRPGGNPARDPLRELEGSLYALTRLGDEIAELNIPRPVTGGHAEEVPIARLLRSPVSLWPAAYATGIIPDGGDGRVAGLGLHPAANGVPERLYYTLANFYGTDPNAPAVGAFDLDLDEAYGPWHAGALPPDNLHPALLARIVFALPTDWAATHTGGRSLVVGNTYLSGCGVPSHGPSLFAVAPWSEGTLPARGAALPAATLVRYSSGDALDGRVVNWSQDEMGQGGAWIGVGATTAVALSTRRSVGEVWYSDQNGGTLYEHNIPQPPGLGRGVGATGWRIGLMLYNPEDLAAVAEGTRDSASPQPYVVFDLDRFSRLPGGSHGEPGAIAYDAEHRRLFALEMNGDPWIEFGNGLIHVWEFHEPSPAPVLSIVTEGGGRLLRWPTVAGAGRYQLQQTAHLGPEAAWENLGPDRAGDGQPMVHGPLETTTLPGPRFYRVRLE